MTGDQITEERLRAVEARTEREAPADAAAVRSLAAVLRGLRGLRGQQDLHPALYDTRADGEGV